MKRPKNLLFAVALSVLAVVSFSSCENNYEWREATMDCYATIYAAPNGVIRDEIQIGYDHILVDDRVNNSIDDIRYYGGEIEIITPDRVGTIRLSLSNSDAYIDLAVPVGGGTYSGYDDSRIDDFLYAVAEVVRRNGYATIYVDGGYAEGYAQLDLDIYIDIDAYVRY